MNLMIKRSVLSGSVRVPPSKSHTLRAILFAALAKGKSLIKNHLHSPDTQAMIQACRLLGAQVDIKPRTLRIQGVSGRPQTPSNVIDAGNSGLVFRFISAIATLTPGYVVITGDDSIRNQRPIAPLLAGIQQLGGWGISTQGNDKAPVVIRGPFMGGHAVVNGADSQPISAILIAALFAEKETHLQVEQPGEKPWIDLTLGWFQRLGLEYRARSYRDYWIPGQGAYEGFEYTVPGDWSSAAFPIVGALITRSEIRLEGLDFSDGQGDQKIIDVLRNMGAVFEIDATQRTLYVKKSAQFRGQVVSVDPIIDAVPILAVMACFAEGETVLMDAGMARQKESDRLSVMTQELRKMGADITAHADRLVIRQSFLNGAILTSHHDHRVAMALSMAGLGATGDSKIEHARCIKKTYPNFISAFRTMGALMSTEGRDE